MGTPQFDGKCIFCRSTGNRSKEHIWPKWYSRNFENRIGNSHWSMRSYHNYSPPSEYSSRPIVTIEPAPLKRPGLSTSRQLRVVCKKCNETWMSKIESNAKDIMIDLILNKQRTISETDGRTIAMWATLKTMIFDFDDLRQIAIPQKDRDIFYNTQTIPTGWIIWIGSYEGDRWISRIKRTGACVGIRGEPIPKQRQNNVQSTTFVAGSLVIHVFSDLNKCEHGFKGMTKNLITEIWPKGEYPIKWPSEFFMRDDDVDLISDALLISSLRTIS